ncbi:ubiquitin carboxyl-terminal hydrolase 2 isoform X4 [Magallana gigas]|uniref:ubiquitin carboxyl-terminal hydrolase 2 isoform X4 n=1 Tax=Magallana gigas TaxID=29159 RepID=UPI0033404C49
MNCCKKRTDMSSNRKSGNIRMQHLKQQTQRSKELQKTTQQFVNQSQTPRKNEHSYNLRSKAVETSQSMVRSLRSTETPKVHTFGRNVKSNRKIQSEFIPQSDTTFAANSNSGIHNSVQNDKLPDILGTKKHIPEYDTQMRPMDNYNLLIKPKRQPPQSLPNIGNTCYANALLQVLGQTPDFYEIVEEACKRETTTKRVTSSFGDLLKHMCTPTFRSIQISVRSFMNNISSREREFMIGYQNDCHSFFLTLLSELHDENPARDITSLFEIEMVDEFIFGSCRHTEITDSQILRSITIPSNSLRIEDGFRELLSEEHFDEEDVPCRQCNRRGFKKTAKAMKFRRLPPILVLQLGCFQEMHYGGHTHIAKSSRRIRFCESVNVPLANGAQDHVTYDLYGVVNHHGSSYGGHYTSYVKQLSSPGDQGPWYYCNDSHIDKANVYTALTSSDAYMLFYKRSQ